jgi:hypothetical protein
MFKPAFFLIIGLIASVALSAQGHTDLYLFQLHKDDKEAYHIYKPQFLSGFNPGGYTNQPCFASDGTLLVSVRIAGEKQNDIYALSIKDFKVKRVTQTTANEYSPRIDPTNQYLSVVRQVVGDAMNQQVYWTRLDGGGFKSITPDRRDVGYYTWLNENQLALFRIEGESNKLEKYNIVDHKARKITSAIGRSLWSDEDGSVLYVHKFSSDYWYLKRYNVDAFSMDIITQTPGMTEDFVLAPDGTYFMGQAGMLFSFHPQHNDAWQEVADLTVYGIDSVTRLAVSPDGTMLALVASKSN